MLPKQEVGAFLTDVYKLNLLYPATPDCGISVNYQSASSLLEF